MKWFLAACYLLALASCGDHSDAPPASPNQPPATVRAKNPQPVFPKSLNFDVLFSTPSEFQFGKRATGEQGKDRYYHLMGNAVAVVRPTQPALSLEGITLDETLEILSPAVDQCILVAKHFSMVGNFQMRIQLAGVDHDQKENCQTFFSKVRSEGLVIKARQVKRPSQYWDEREVIFEEVNLKLKEFASFGP